MEQRYTRLTSEEAKLYTEGYHLLAGVDEVGRGPLAGPVIAACVIFPKGLYIDGIDDSKKISTAKRERLYEEIMNKALSVGIGTADNEEIDRTNIVSATFKAMHSAIADSTITPEFILIDAVKLTNCNLPQLSLIKGDERSHSIAAASIIAKVTRDREMLNWHKIYPQYLFDKHKGYGTAEHINRLRNHGLCSIHRTTFCKGYF